jgi:hypothetical protein
MNGFSLGPMSTGARKGFPSTRRIRCFVCAAESAGAKGKKDAASSLGTLGSAAQKSTTKEGIELKACMKAGCMGAWHEFSWSLSSPMSVAISWPGCDLAGCVGCISRARPKHWDMKDDETEAEMRDPASLQHVSARVWPCGPPRANN